MLSVSDFFCGCGGLSQGFREAGFNIKNGIDFNKSFLETYAQNFPEAKVLNLDLGDNKFIDKCKKSKIDGLIVVDLPYPENKPFALKCKKKANLGGYHGLALTECFAGDPKGKEVIKYLENIF